MPPIVPDAPWWANIALLMAAVVSSTLVVYLPTREKLRKIDKQVSNSHTTNLRDDLTEAIDEVKSLRTDISHVSDDVTHVRESTQRIDRRLDALKADIQDERKERLRHENWSEHIVREHTKAIERVAQPPHTRGQEES